MIQVIPVWTEVWSRGNLRLKCGDTKTMRFFSLENNSFTSDFQASPERRWENDGEVDAGIIHKTDATMYIKSTITQTCNATLANSLMAWMSTHSF